VADASTVCQYGGQPFADPLGSNRLLDVDVKVPERTHIERRRFLKTAVGAAWATPVVMSMVMSESAAAATICIPAGTLAANACPQAGRVCCQPLVGQSTCGTPTGGSSGHCCYNAGATGCLTNGQCCDSAVGMQCGTTGANLGKCCVPNNQRPADAGLTSANCCSGNTTLTSAQKCQ
jgi:hypothetical protein